MWRSRSVSRSANNSVRTHLPPGPITRRAACTRLPKRLTPGWPSSKQARELLLPNATTEVVASRVARRFRPHDFLEPKSPEAAKRAIRAIRHGIKALGKHPEIGRPVEEMLPEFREWVIEFASGAYVALYHFNGKEIVILAVRHGREVGY